MEYFQFEGIKYFLLFLQLFLFNFYPFIQRFLQPHQRGKHNSFVESFYFSFNCTFLTICCLCRGDKDSPVCCPVFPSARPPWGTVRSTDFTPEEHRTFTITLLTLYIPTHVDHWTCDHDHCQQLCDGQKLRGGHDSWVSGSHGNVFVVCFLVAVNME